MEIKNDRQKAKIKILKVDSRNNKNPIEGCTFELYSSQDNYKNKIATKTTSESGIVEFENLRVGYNFKVKEVATNQYYILDKTEKEIFISDAKQYNLTVKNDPDFAYIQVEKADADYKDIKLSGFEFTIYEDTNKNGILDSSDKSIQVLTTKSNGRTEKSKVLYLDTVYFIKESKARSDYRTDFEVRKVTFNKSNAKETLTYNFYNKKRDGGLNIYKVDERDNKTPIEGAEFELYSKEFNRVIQTGKTDKNGRLTFSNIRIGDVLVREIRNK